MCTNSNSSPTSMRKRKVTFFDRVRIREIQVICLDEWSETDDEDILDSEYDYQTDLVRDLGDYDEALNTEPRKTSMSAKYSSKSRTNNSRKTLDWSGKIYSSTQTDFQSDRIDPKFLPLPSLKADRWESSSPCAIPRRRMIPLDEEDQSISKSDSNDSNDSNQRLTRIQTARNEGKYFRKGSHLDLPIRRPSSTESLTRSVGRPPLSSSSGSNSNWKRITSAPTLMRRKKGSKNRPSLADSRNATFGAPKNNKPPLLPTRWGSRRNVFLLERVNENNEQKKNLNGLSDVSDSSHTTATSSTSASNNPDCDVNIDDSEEFGVPEPSPNQLPMTMESPKTNRRNLLQRSMGSLRKLTDKSPLTRSKKGRNDMPPKRPIRLSSVRTLQIEDL